MATVEHAHPDGGSAHSHPHVDYASRAHPEFVAIDIGEECGALIVHADPQMHGVEIEISPAADDAARQHKEVLERRIAGEPAFTAVFDRIGEGRHTLWVGGEARARDVDVTAGAVAELDWRTSP